jgi:AraC family transcriptional regulator
MNPVNKALWFIETHYAREICLEEIAGIAGVSRYHLARAFTIATGQPALRYTRGRRLSEAARALAAGAPDILTLALEVGYNSHEAFTRAFRDQFGVTPEAVRSQGHLDNIQLVEALKMDETLLTQLEPPRFEDRRALLVAGLSALYTCESSSGIPAQWQKFVPHIGTFPGQIGSAAYGVRYNSDEEGNFGYLCAVQVEDFSKLAAHWARLRIPAHRYAVFAHRDHVSTIRRTWNTIYNKWLPDSGHRVADAPELERYGEGFDSRTGVGDIEIWIPIQG